MQRSVVLVVFLLCGLAAVALRGGGDDKPSGAAEKEATKKEAPALTEREKKFKEALENSTLAGRWRLVEGGKLGAESEDRYTIGLVEKATADVWRIHARVQYGEKDVSLPVPVKVFWAGDTPVISITNAGLPGLGTYSARVLIHEGYYTGTWSGPGHAGFLTGVVQKAAKGGG